MAAMLRPSLPLALALCAASCSELNPPGDFRPGDAWDRSDVAADAPASTDVTTPGDTPAVTDAGAIDAPAATDAPTVDAATTHDTASDTPAPMDLPPPIDVPIMRDVAAAPDVPDVPSVVDVPFAADAPVAMDVAVDRPDVPDVPPPACSDGATQPCYSGPDGTVSVGRCRAGSQTCAGGAWGACRGETLPAPETCNNVDDDCDGTADDGATAACAARPNTGATCAAGSCVYACVAGYVDCNLAAADGCETIGACVSLTDGLVVHHPFDGTAVDIRYGANGTVIGVSFVNDRFNNPSRAARFSASSSGFSGSSVVVPSNSRLPVGASPRTMALWISDRRNTSTWQYRSVVGYGDIMTGTRFGVSMQADFVARTDRPIFSGQSADVGGSTDLLDSRWHHVAATYDGSTVRLYVDGALNNSGAQSLNTTTQMLYIGRAPVRMSEYFDGDIDDLRIYDRALRANEISALYHLDGWP